MILYQKNVFAKFFLVEILKGGGGLWVGKVLKLFWDVFCLSGFYLLYNIYF